MTQQYQLAQLNIAELKAPLDSPELADFVANLDRINALAESSEGYVWRLKTDDGDATAIRDFGESTLVNMSVWKDVDALNTYVYRSGHVDIMRRRREWFERMANIHMVLWWVPEGHLPTVEEAAEKLALLRLQGPSPAAFTFRQAYPPPGAARGAEPHDHGDACPA